MRIGIKYKLVIALLVSNSLLAAVMFTVSSWRFDEGFLTYLTEIEIQRLQPLFDELAIFYGEHQSWQLILDEPRIWNDFMFNNVRPNLPPPPVFGRQGPPPRGAPLGRHQMRLSGPGPRRIFDPRIILADADRIQLIGPPAGQQFNVHWQGIEWNQQVVGYIGIMRGNLPEDSLDSIFVVEQRTTYGWIAFGSLFIALSLGLTLAIIWLRPINRLQQALVQLSAGDFSQCLKSKGTDEMADLASRFNILARTLQENKSIQSQWVADISHELRTPLSILIGEIEALVDGVRPADEKQLQSLHEEAIHLQALVGQLHELNMSDLGSEKIPPISLHSWQAWCGNSLRSVKNKESSFSSSLARTRRWLRSTSRNSSSFLTICFIIACATQTNLAC